MATFRLSAVFSRFLRVGEAKEILRRITAEYTQFVLDHYVQWAREEGLDTAEIETFIREAVPAQLKALIDLPD